MADQYPIVLAGAGLSGLSLATRLASSSVGADEQILLIDRDRKQQNDRTWCFWATPAEIEALPPIIRHSWSAIDFFSPQHSERLAAGEYRYCMVRGADFYAWAKEELARYPNVQWLHADIEQIEGEQGLVHTTEGKIRGRLIFNSAFTPYSLLPTQAGLYERPPFSHGQQQVPAKAIHLLQHFKGWIIETPEPAFDIQVARLMDFRIEQHGYTRFVYVLPFSEREALVEYTVFSPGLLAADEYGQELRAYIEQYLGVEEFRIKETEFGVIPMTDVRFRQQDQARLIHIGTAGGFVKGSSGYAYKRTHEKMDRFVQDWVKNGRPDPTLLRSERQYRVYDSIFLRALNDNLVSSQVVFSSFFKNLGGRAVFRFLDEKTSLAEDFRALSAVPTLPFSKAFFRQGLRLSKV